MIAIRKILLLLLVFCVLPLANNAQQASKLLDLLNKRLPDASIKKLKPDAHFSEVFEIRLTQPIDHYNPAVGNFQQLIYLKHIDRKKPMVMETEGYAAGNKTNELSKILKSNLLVIEYRYMGSSKPIKMDWKYLTNDQAIEDLHRIKKLFKKIYKKKWVSTGISKGGQTTLIYKSKYPKDVCVAVPYVAPMPEAQEDLRTNTHQETIGTSACRQKIKTFQRAALTKRKEMIEMLSQFASKNQKTFSIGTDVALEYAVLEFPFSFWQWGGDCDAIPTTNASTKEIFDYINEIVSWNFYSDASYEYFKPSFYQFMTELGYYGFPKDHVKDLLVALPNPSNLRFGPKDVDLTYKHYLKPVNEYLKNKGEKIIYIYGEYDTWSACAISPAQGLDALKMVKKKGDHTTRIKHFSKEEQQRIYDKLKKWLKTFIYPLE